MTKRQENKVPDINEILGMDLGDIEARFVSQYLEHVTAREIDLFPAVSPLQLDFLKSLGEDIE